MAFLTQKSAQLAQKVHEPRKKRRVMSCPSSVSTAVVLMAPPAQTRSHMPQEMHLSAWKTILPL